MLRVLQEGKVRPFGSNDEVCIDVRIVAATHRGPPSLVAQKKFQEDLYFRVPLTMSLRELEEQYILAYCKAHPKKRREDVATGLGINRKTLYRKFQEMRADGKRVLS